MSTFARTSILAAAVLAGVVTLGIPASLRAGPSTHTIVVDNLEFGPAPNDLRVGDVVEWRNRDLFRHSATASDGSFDVDLPAGGTGKTILKKSGEIAYYCRYHPGMKGVLAVAP